MKATTVRNAPKLGAKDSAKPAIKPAKVASEPKAQKQKNVSVAKVLGKRAAMLAAPAGIKMTFSIDAEGKHAIFQPFDGIVVPFADTVDSIHVNCSQNHLSIKGYVTSGKNAGTIHSFLPVKEHQYHQWKGDTLQETAQKVAEFLEKRFTGRTATTTKLPDPVAKAPKPPKKGKKGEKVEQNSEPEKTEQPTEQSAEQPAQEQTEPVKEEEQTEQVA